ncbi:MAG: Transcriptional regulator and biotin acetyl-CoA-carboxylase synthetase, partial [uncultured bacterium]
SLKTIKLGKNIHYLPEVDSTNLWAARTMPYSIGDVFLADYQSGGYGRLKRTWESPRGKNILMTFIDEAPLDPSKIPQLTLVCGVAIAKAMREFNIPVTLKWPNDLFVQKRKLGGILCEADGGIVRIGVGLNINSTPADYSETLKPNVTSAFRELGKELPLEEVIAKCLTQYELTRHHYDITGVSHLLQEWETLTIPKGTTVRINDDGRTFEAKYNGVSPDGFLLVQVGDKIEKIISGDLILI